MILTELQSNMRDATRAYAQERILPRSREFESAGCYPREMGELGLFGMTAPEAGSDASAIRTGAIQTLGGYGYLEEFGVAKIYRDVRVCQIYEGTSDIQRMVIARAL